VNKARGRGNIYRGVSGCVRELKMEEVKASNTILGGVRGLWWDGLDLTVPVDFLNVEMSNVEVSASGISTRYCNPYNYLWW